LILWLNESLIIDYAVDAEMNLRVKVRIEKVCDVDSTRVVHISAVFWPAERISFGCGGCNAHT
jgi:hypothetical protein